MRYRPVANEQYIPDPTVNMGTCEADGDANSRDGIGLQLTHVDRQGCVRLVLDAAFHQTYFDEANPMFGEPRDKQELLITGSAFYGNTSDVSSLWGVARPLAERECTITFYDAEAFVPDVGLLYRF